MIEKYPLCARRISRFRKEIKELEQAIKNIYDNLDRAESNLKDLEPKG